MIRLHTAGRQKPARLLRLLAESGSWLARLLAIEMVLPTSAGDIRFHCTNAQTLRRACTFFIKEEGTVAWLDRTLRPGDVFLDVGANVGIYTLYGAQRVGPSGRVFAVEPHLRNAVALMENLQLNNFGDRVSLLTTALAERTRPAQFDYLEWRTGSSHSQLADTAHAPAEAVQAAARASGISELKIAQSVDSLLAEGALQAPNVVKIDVDGIELPILQGMRGLLTSAARPRSLQVECAPNDGALIEAELAACGYRLVQRHATMAGNKQLSRAAPKASQGAGEGVGQGAGAEAETAAMLKIAHNAVFEPAA